MAKRRRKYNPKDWTPIGLIGDVNPIEHWGGVIYETPYGIEMLYFQISEEDQVAVYRVDIEDDVIADLDWADWDDIASFTGQDVDEIKKVGRGDNVIGRAQVYDAAASYHGWNNLDDSPELLTVEEAEAKYDDDIEAAHKARKANPCKKGEILIDRRGYKRKGSIRKDGTPVKAGRVPPSSFCIRDPGTKGRRARGAEKGPFRKEAPWIEDTGSLGGPGYTKKPAKTRHQILDRCVRKEDYRSCLGKIMVLLRSTQLKAATRKTLEADKKYLMKKYGGPGSFGPEANPENRLKGSAAEVAARLTGLEKHYLRMGSAERFGEPPRALVEARLVGKATPVSEPSYTPSGERTTRHAGWRGGKLTKRGRAVQRVLLTTEGNPRVRRLATRMSNP